MFITNHVLVGSLVGLSSPNTATAFAGGFVSHFLLDAIPHMGAKNWVRAGIIDGLVGLTVAGVVYSKTPKTHRQRLVAGVAGACLPDSDKPLMLFTGAHRHPSWFKKFHGAIQNEDPKWWTNEAATALMGMFAVSEKLSDIETEEKFHRTPDASLPPDASL